MTTIKNTDGKKRLITDAHEPNAGTDFHVLWCIERALSLLNFKESGLALIGVESLTPKDQIEIDPDGDKLLAVDLCEYYDGDAIDNASKVVISQLKYSTKHSTTEWTVSKICEGKKAGGKGSIIDRFASTFKAIDGASHSDKIEIKLISNRPAHTDLAYLVNYATSCLSNSRSHIQANQSLKTNLAKIGKVAKLTGDDLLKFLSRLNFDECNAASRTLLRSQNRLKISDLGIQESQRELAVLEAFVRSKSYPESKKNNTINRNDVLMELGVPTFESIFPVQNSFKESSIVNRAQVDEILRSIRVAKSSYPVCVHGPAGIGKTTFLQQIKSLSPEDIFILFDCYGGGSYLDPEDLRHLHKYALLTLCNEVARNIGTPLLLVRNESEDFYIREFAKRIKDASRILQEIKPNSRLFICLDAADNSISAADRSGDKSFVSDLAKLKYPDNIKVIITTRTFRKDFLKVNDEIIYFELQPFTVTETNSFLELNSIIASKSDLNELQLLTEGIPRAISYTIESIGSTLSAKMEPLRPNGKNMDDIFKSLTEDAALRSGNRALFKKIIKLLVTLPRPIPISFVNEVMKIDDNFFNDIIIDLSSGIRKNGDHIHFNDEDFEAFLNNWSQFVKIDYEALSEVFIERADREEYSSVHLGRYLELGGKHEELRQIVLERKFLKKPEDHYKNVKTFLGRAKIAMRNAATEKDLVIYSKLQTITAEASSSNHILESLLLNNPELEAIFIYDPTLDRRHSVDKPVEYLGSYYLRAAAILSRSNDSHEVAKSLFALGNSWIKKWKSADSPDNDYRLEEIDISYGIEACLRLSGFDKAVDWSDQWTSRSMIFELLYNTVIRIINFSDKADIDAWKEDVNFLRTDVKIEILKAFRDAGILLKIDITGDVRLLTRYFSIFGKTMPNYSNNLYFIIEQLLERGETDVAKELLSIINIRVPQRLPSFSGYHWEKENEQGILFFLKHHIYLGYLTNSPIEINTLLPESEKTESKSAHSKTRNDSEDRQKLQQFYEIMLPIIKFRLSILTSNNGDLNLLNNLNTTLSSISYPYDFPDRFGSQYKITNLICEELFNLVWFTEDKKSFFDIIKDQCLRLSSNRSDLLLYLANKASLVKQTAFIEEFLAEADKNESSKIKPGSEMVSFYQEATVIANSVSFNLSKFYFDKLVEATQEIDLEAFDRIRLIPALVTTENGPNWETAWSFARYVEYCAIKLKGYEDFPWTLAIDGISKIDPFAVLPIICNWDHRSVEPINSLLLNSLSQLLDQEVLSKESVSALITCQNIYWNGYCEILDKLLTLYLKDASIRKRRQFLDFVMNDFMFEMNNGQQQRLLPKILEILKKHKLQDTKSVRKMEQYRAYLDKDAAEKTYVPSINNRIEKEFILEATLDIEEHESLETYLINIKQDTHRYFSEEEKSKIVNKIKTTDKEGFKNYLSVLIGLKNDLIPFYFFSEILEESIGYWILQREIKSWILDNFEQLLLVQNCAYLRIGDYERLEQLNKLRQTCQISDEYFHSIILKVVPSILENLNGVELYRLLELTSLGMKGQERSSFTQWLINLWGTKVKQEFQFNIPKESEIAKSEQALLTGVYRYLLGHPDKRLRWRTARSLIKIISLGNTSLIGEMIQKQDEQTCSTFTDINEPFYWLASKTWLWIVLHKISVQNPDTLLNWMHRIKQEFTTPLFPHAQILWFVRATCLNLEKAFPKLFSDSELEIIENVLNSTVKNSSDKKRQTSKSTSKQRFKFNYLDTVEYWYKGLGRCFGISANEVATIIDDILIDDWLISADFPAVNNTTNYNGDLTWHRKHERPVVEPYQTYLEYQGMQCAAMKLLKKYPLKDDDNDWGSWSYWISEQGLLWDNYWLSDLKDPIPAEKDFWEPEHITKYWKYEITFEKLFNLPQYGGIKNDIKTFILKEYSTIHWGKDYESRTISSALVKSKYGNSALITVQTLDGSYFHHLQSEEILDGRDEEDMIYERSANQSTDIHSEGFLFFPTTKTLNPERNSIDEYDESIKGMRKGRWILSSIFTKRSQIQISPDKRISFENNSPENPVSFFENWSNTPEREGHGQSYSTGTRLYIREDWLLTFLKVNELSLLLQTEIQRHQDDSKSSFGNEDYSLYHLIQSDGTIHTLSGNFKLG